MIRKGEPGSMEKGIEDLRFHNVLAALNYIALQTGMPWRKLLKINMLLTFKGTLQDYLYHLPFTAAAFSHVFSCGYR
jgi:hypothetical protein